MLSARFQTSINKKTPQRPATECSPGTIEKGMDGKEYEAKEQANGRMRWYIRRENGHTNSYGGSNMIRTNGNSNQKSQANKHTKRGFSLPQLFDEHKMHFEGSKLK